MNNNEEIIKARDFCNEVKKLAKLYDLPFFVVTNGASAISNNGNPAVHNARECHKEWEMENGFDPNHNWEENK